QVHPTAPSAPEVERRLESLGRGEQEAIRLAHYLGVPLLIDEAKGRAAARTLGIEVIGAIGVLLDAKEANLIPRVLPMLEELRRPRPQERARPGGAAAADPARRRPGRELQPRHDGAPGLPLRGGAGAEPATDLRLDLGLRPDRPVPQQARLRPHHPGHVRLAEL